MPPYERSSLGRSMHTNHEGDILLSTQTIESIDYFAAGGIASATSRTATAPLDRLKVYMIVQTGSHSTTSTAQGSSHPLQTINRSLRSLQAASRSIWAAGGISSLWAGNGLNVVKMLPEGATKFGCYESMRRFFVKIEGVSDPSKISGTAQFVSGGIGGVAAQTIAYPIDTLRFRIQCELREGGVHGRTLMLDTVRKMCAVQGYRAFFRGLSWGLIGQFPYSAIDLLTFEYTKAAAIRRKKIRSAATDDLTLSPVTIAAIGAFSGALGASLVWPINMLRTRLQTQGTSAHRTTYSGMFDCIAQTMQKDGLRGFFRGITPNLVKVVPSCAITYVVYERSKRALNLQ